jgi:hypothetical protein
LQKRVVGVKVESVENVEKGVEGIGIAAVWKTHARLRFDDGLQGWGYRIQCIGRVMFAVSDKGISLYGA